MKYLLLVPISLILMFSTVALSDCIAGRLTTLITSYQVYKKDAKGSLQAIPLTKGTEVHIIATHSDAIEIYAMKENGLGTVYISRQNILK